VIAWHCTPADLRRLLFIQDSPVQVGIAGHDALNLVSFRAVVVNSFAAHASRSPETADSAVGDILTELAVLVTWKADEI